MSGTIEEHREDHDAQGTDAGVIGDASATSDDASQGTDATEATDANTNVEAGVYDASDNEDGGPGTSLDASWLDASDGGDEADGSSDASPTSSDGGTIDGGGNDSGIYPGAENRSGDRLKIRTLETADGVGIFNGWWDATLGASCLFGTTSDGVTRCIPTGGEVAYATQLYSDSNCTIPVALVEAPSCATPPRWIQKSDNSVCPNRMSFYETGARITSSAGFQKDSTTQACVSTTFPTSIPDYNYYEAGTLVDPGQFATGQPELDASLGAVAIRAVTTDDGAHAFLGYLDTRTNTQCTIWRTYDDVPRCLPIAPASPKTDTFSDAACTQPVATVADANVSCAETLFAAERKISNCITHFRLYETGNKVSQTYGEAGAVCAETTPTVGLSSFELKAAIPDTSFIEATFSRPTTASSRLLPGTYQMLGQAFPGSSALFDTHRNELCMFTTAADGKVRCLPTSRLSDIYYRDPECAEPLLYLLPLEGCTDVPTVARIYDKTVCPTLARVIAVGAEVQPNLVYLKFSSDSCQSTSPPQAPGALFFLEGAEIPPTDFVEATEQLR